MKRKQQLGVTLFELMITVAVIAVMVGIAIPIYSGYTLSAYRTECTNEVAAIELAQNEFFLENNTYFGNGLDTGSGDTVTDIENASGNLYVSGYTVPGNAGATTNNINDAYCTYAITTTAVGYTITATGQNELAGKGCVTQKPVACP